MKAYVYKILNTVNGKYYVGSTIHLQKRIARHFSSLRSNSHHNFLLQDDYNKYGDSSFTIEVVAVFDEEKQAKDLEQKLITEDYDKNYNLGKYAEYGKDLVSYHPKHDKICKTHSMNNRYRYEHMTDEERKEISEMFKGDKNPMYGKHHSKEALEKIRQANLGRIPYNKNKSLEECFGEEKAKMIKAKESEYAKQRTGSKNGFYGKQHTEETKRKISLANKNRIPTNAYKVKIDGIIYDSLTEASRQLKINLSTVLYRIRSKNFKNYIKL